MKLSAEEIRNRAAAIAAYATTEKILKLIEDATGEKLPEPFDERNVIHGAVFQCGQEVFILTQRIDGLFIGLFSNGAPSKTQIVGDRDSIIDTLKNDNRGCRYLGQYDFARGLEHLIK